jgi:hypothetical protein
MRIGFYTFFHLCFSFVVMVFVIFKGAARCNQLKVLKLSCNNSYENS